MPRLLKASSAAIAEPTANTEFKANGAGDAAVPCGKVLKERFRKEVFWSQCFLTYSRTICSTGYA